MPRYLIRATYTADGMQGVLKEGGSGRKAAVATMFEKAGGKLESFYFAFGEDDVYVIGELPDNTTAAGLMLTVAAGGGVKAHTVVLLDPEEIDQAAKKAYAYRPPGRS